MLFILKLVKMDVQEIWPEDWVIHLHCKRHCKFFLVIHYISKENFQPLPVWKKPLPDSCLVFKSCLSLLAIGHCVLSFKKYCFTLPGGSAPGSSNNTRLCMVKMDLKVLSFCVDIAPNVVTLDEWGVFFTPFISMLEKPWWCYLWMFNALGGVS